jgi:hypothetical protein
MSSVAIRSERISPPPAASISLETSRRPARAVSCEIVVSAGRL